MMSRHFGLSSELVEHQFVTDILISTQINLNRVLIVRITGKYGIDLTQYINKLKSLSKLKI